MGHWMLEHDGIDPRMIGIATSAARVGHVLQYDVDSLHYASENKNVVLNKTWATWWLQVIEQAKMRGKYPMLRIDPPNKIDGQRIPQMHIITAERHAQLLAYEKLCEKG